MKYISFIFACLFYINPSFGLELSGFLQQGGYVIGQTVPGAEVKLGVQKAVVDEKGNFAVGVPRLAPENMVLSINLLGGIEEQHKLKIAQRDYKTQYIKGVKKKHVTPRSEADLKRIREDSAQIKNARSVVESLPFIQGGFIQPVKGPITGVYGSRRYYNGEERNWHKGTDFAAKTGTPIVAPAGGVVRLALADSFFNGNLVVLDHGYQMMTVYAHMDSMAVKAGQKVKQGDLLGTVGSTGRSTGPHLHWGLYFGNLALDPMLLLKEKQSLR